MRALVVYESMYGNTHTVADAIATGLGEEPTMDGVVVLPVGHVDAAALDAADLVVVGGPTHVHGMSRASTREQAVRDGQAAGSTLDVDPDAEGPGVRDWLATVQGADLPAVAFDTRVDMALLLSGRASKGIAKALRHCGFREAAAPESFLVTKDSHLLDGEADRARQWGRSVAARVVEAAAPHRS